MIFGNVNRLEWSPTLPANFVEYIKKAQKIAEENQENGRYEIDGDKVFAIMATPETEPKEDRKTEIHRDHLDIQLIIEGEETFGFSNETPQALIDKEEFNNDVVLFNEVGNESFISTKAGDFLIFYPGESHRPQCATREPAVVRKMIIKVHKSMY